MLTSPGSRTAELLLFVPLDRSLFFQAGFLDCRWKETDYVKMPHVQHFTGVVHLLQQLHHFDAHFVAGYLGRLQRWAQGQWASQIGFDIINTFFRSISFMLNTERSFLRL